MKDIYILAIESSCDETSMSIIKNGCEEIATIVLSQIDIHKEYGGVVPEIASRNHIENITIVLEELLAKARMTIDLIRGKSIAEARAVLVTTNTKASRLISKVLESAIANATNNFGADESKLYIKETYINAGTVLKRSKIASRGNVDRRDKRTSHIYIKLSDGVVKED